MIPLTRQERYAVCLLLFVGITGASVRYVFKRSPEFFDLVNVLDDASVYTKVNINTAAADQLTRLPYIGASTAREIIAYRERHGPFDEVKDIMNVPGIGAKRFELVKRYCVTRKR